MRYGNISAEQKRHHLLLNVDQSGGNSLTFVKLTNLTENNPHGSVTEVVMDKNTCERAKRKLLIHIFMSKGKVAVNSAYKIPSPEFQTTVT